MPDDFNLTNHNENLETRTFTAANAQTAIALMAFIVLASYCIGVANG